MQFVIAEIGIIHRVPYIPLNHPITNTRATRGAMQHYAYGKHHHDFSLHFSPTFFFGF